jgi:hypothetical protein
MFDVFACSVVFLLGDLALPEVPEGFPGCFPGFCAFISDRFSGCPGNGFFGCQVDYFVDFF